MSQRRSDRVIAYFKRNWITIGLVAGLVLSVTNQLTAATWCRDCDLLIAMVVLGSLYGAALASTRFSARSAALQSLLVSLLLLLLAIGRVLPTSDTLATLPIGETIRLMNLRLMALLD
jgi:hypothetical protein